MARTKRWSQRGKRRVQQLPGMRIDRYPEGTYVVLDLTVSTAIAHYPWCALSGAEPQPCGGAQRIERAAVELVQPDTAS